MRNFTLAALAALASAALVAQPASAHTVSTGRVVYRDSSLCVINTSRITMDHASGEMIPFASTNFRLGDCQTIDVKPPGQIGVRYYLQKWDGVSAWRNCHTSNTVYNSSENWEVSVSSPPLSCGSGWYRLRSTSIVWDGSTWQGGLGELPQHPPV